MATFIQSSSKRQKVAREAVKSVEINEYFPGINKIEFKGDNLQFDDTLHYRFYNANERIHSRAMEDWIKPAISFSILKYHGYDSHGKSLFQRNCDNHNSAVENCKYFIAAAFELCVKLGVKYWTAFDRDLVPELESYEETCLHMDEITEFILDLQQRFNLKPLWIGPDFQSNLKYNFGAGTSHDAYIMMHGSQQTKRCLELAQKLNAEGFVMSSAREGYNNILNTDIQKEMKHYARLLKMTSDYKERLGFRGQLLLQATKCNEFINHNMQNNTHCKSIISQYIYDAMSGFCFLKHYNLERHYKMIVNPGHQFHLCTAYNILGATEICQNETLSIIDATILMKTFLEQGGLQSGGINLQISPCKLRMEYKDLFIYYMRQIDTLARGLRISAKIVIDQFFSKNIQQRYITYYSGFGSRLSNGEASLEECEENLRKHQHQTPENPIANRNEHWDAAFHNFINGYRFNC